MVKLNMILTGKGMSKTIQVTALVEGGGVAIIQLMMRASEIKRAASEI